MKLFILELRASPARWLLFFLGASAACAQPFSAGLKLGVPLTDFVSTVQNASSSAPNRYLVGVMAELRLPFGLGVELDAIYRHINYSDNYRSTPTVTTSDRTTASAWEFPLLLKYHLKLHAPLVRPYAEAGVAWDTLSGLTDTITQSSSLPLSSSSNPSALANNTVRGFVMGAGVDIHAVVIHVSPELRYTRWGSPHFNLNGILSSNQNQAEFLVGITF